MKDGALKEAINRPLDKGHWEKKCEQVMKKLTQANYASVFLAILLSICIAIIAVQYEVNEKYTKEALTDQRHQLQKRFLSRVPAWKVKEEEYKRAFKREKLKAEARLIVAKANTKIARERAKVEHIIALSKAKAWAKVKMP